MPELLFSSETTSCGVTLRLDSGEACMVSFAEGGVLVREHSEGKFLGNSFGRKLFEKNNPDVVAKIATRLELSTLGTNFRLRSRTSSCPTMPMRSGTSFRWPMPPLCSMRLRARLEESRLRPNAKPTAGLTRAHQQRLAEDWSAKVVKKALKSPFRRAVLCAPRCSPPHSAGGAGTCCTPRLGQYNGRGEGQVECKP